MASVCGFSLLKGIQSVNWPMVTGEAFLTYLKTQKCTPRFTQHCTFLKVRRKSEMTTHTHTHIYMLKCICIYKAVQMKSEFQHDGTSSAAACVIAQQYSSAKFVSVRFHTRKEKFSALLNEVIIQPFILLKLPTSEYA